MGPRTEGRCRASPGGSANPLRLPLRGRMSEIGPRRARQPRSRMNPSSVPLDMAFRRAEEALREREERYRTLFDAMDEGYCIIEVLFDDRQAPVDYRFIEVNGSFERQAGMRDVVGKRMLEF